MKLLRLEVENLNSLYGTHTVDFERDLADAPLFMIVGPTGSGKTTLLDAIALALFGQTPRLRRAKSSDPEEDARNVIARGTTVARAELTFRATVAGEDRVYRASWSCTRSKRGILQDPIRALRRRTALPNTWELVIEAKKKSVFQPKFDDVLDGLTVEDFKRCMLLAQGEFAAFVQASEEDRAALLERLTDTSAYQKIGAAAARRRQHAARSVDEVRERLDGAHLADEGEIAHAVRARDAAALEREKCEQRRKEIDAGLQWLDVGDRAARALADAHRRLEGVQTRTAVHREALEALAAHERVTVAFPWLREIATLDARDHERANARSACEDSMAALTREEEIARLEEAEASGRLRAAEGDEATVGLQLPRAYALHERLDAERARWDEANNQQTAMAAQRRVAHANEATTHGHLDATTEAFDAAARGYAAVQRFEPLVLHVASWRERLRQIDDGHARVAKLKGAGAALEAEAAQIAMSVATHTEAERAAGALLAGHCRARDDAESALRAALAGHADAMAARAVWRTRARVRAERLRDVRDLEALRATLAEVRAEVAHQRATGARLAEALRVVEDDVRANEAARATHAEALDSLRWALGLALERGRLVTGEPCPLCGSRTHDVGGPHADDAARAARAAEIDDALARLAVRGDVLAGERLALRDGVAKAASALALRETQREEALARKATLEGRLGLLATPEAIPEAVRAIETDERMDDEAAAALGRAETALHERVDAQRVAEQTHHTALLRLEQRRADRTTNEVQRAKARADLDECLDETARREGDLRGELRALGVQQSSLAGSLAEAEARALEVTAAGALRNGALAARDDAAGAHARAKEALDRAEREHAGAESRVHERRAVWESAVADAGTLFEGESPHVVAKRVEDARKAAAEHVRIVVERIQGIAQALSHARGMLAEMREAQGRDEAIRARVEASLGAFLRDAQVLDRAALRAMQLTDKVHAERTALRRDLEADLRSATDAFALADRMWNEHLAARPETLAVSDDAPTLMAEREALATQARAWADAIAATDAKLHAWETERIRRAADLAELARRHAAYEVWKDLHDLIGVDDGNAFRTFAQTLNLEDLLSRANEHLARLADRYALVPLTMETGAPRLAFAVRDAFQGGEVRPLVTLSGGETFLVSLALALGLASYREVRLPMGTLLLDEGFGMLDPDTLNTVVTVLQRLGAQGIQVGVVSHVTALAERIDARIVVTPQGQGRSTVRVERGPL